MASDGRVYMAKGNKTSDFYAVGWDYDFEKLAPIPPGPTGKTPRAGCRGACDGERYVYMVKGSRTNEFCRYDIVTNAWEQMPDVRHPARGGAVKDGSDLVCVEAGGRTYLYLLKGSGFEFWRFDVTADSWQALPSAPTGAGKRWKSGSWLVWNRNNSIYAHKGYYPELFRYDIMAGAWDPDPLTSMPQAGSGGTHRAKSGSAGAWHDGVLYALKGSTTELWSYYPQLDSWCEIDSIPSVGRSGKRRKFGRGADMVSHEEGNVPLYLLVLKGGRTLEFWRYETPSDGEQLPPGDRTVEPAPAGNSTGTALLSLGRSYTGTEPAVLLDASGRKMRNLSPGSALDGLPPGVYFVRQPAAVRKLVIPR